MKTRIWRKLGSIWKQNGAERVQNILEGTSWTYDNKAGFGLLIYILYIWYLYFNII